MPIMLAPLGVRTPMTLKATLFTRTSLPPGISPLEELPDHALAQDADLAAVADVLIREHLALRPGPIPGRRARPGVVP